MFCIRSIRDRRRKAISRGEIDLTVQFSAVTLLPIDGDKFQHRGRTRGGDAQGTERALVWRERDAHLSSCDTGFDRPSSAGGGAAPRNGVKGLDHVKGLDQWHGLMVARMSSSSAGGESAGALHFLPPRGILYKNLASVVCRKVQVVQSLFLPFPLSVYPWREDVESA